MLWEVQLTPKARLSFNDNGSTLAVWFIADSDFGDTVTKSMPWSYTLNSVRESWRSAHVYAGQWQKLVTLYADKSQTITIHIGETGTQEIAGPHDHDVYVVRGDILSVGRVTQGAGTRRAVPYVNVNGVWRLAESYAKHAGSWKQTI